MLLRVLIPTCVATIYRFSCWLGSRASLTRLCTGDLQVFCTSLQLFMRVQPWLTVQQR